MITDTIHNIREEKDDSQCSNQPKCCLVVNYEQQIVISMLNIIDEYSHNNKPVEWIYDIYRGSAIMCQMFAA